jgi:Xaa-Pro dipeptidase
MSLDRRSFASMLAGALGASALSFDTLAAQPRLGPTPAVGSADPCHPPEQVAALKPMLDGVKPISDDDRKARLARAQQLMGRQGIAALLLEPGTSMTYFTGMGWGLSERPFVAILPAKGDLAFVCPGFEEARARERLRFTKDVRVWQEDESPYKVMATVLNDRGVRTGKIAMEERVRFFIADGLRHAAPALTLVSGDPISAGCRMHKSAAELALMQRANDITIAALKVSLSLLREGMTQYELGDIQEQAMRKLGGSDTWSLVGFGAASAFPHGSVQPQRLREGDIVLVDTGCAVEDYQADITRTTVFGTPTARQTEIWNLERRAQDAAFAAAKLGTPAGAVDDAARQVITDAGFGPDYRVPGLPHRTGHGIGMDGHEWTNFVRGNMTRLAPGMCFSDEPMIAIYGEFGIRLEDCLYITEEGPKFFTKQSPAIDQPFG